MASTLNLVSAGDHIRVWDCRGYSLIKQFNPHPHNVSDISWNCDNTCLASTSNHGDSLVLTYCRGTTYTSQELDIGSGHVCVDFSSTPSRYLATGTRDNAVNVWDIKTAKLRKQFKGHTSRITVVRFNRNSSYVASASEAGQIALHNVVTEQTSQPLTARRMQAIRDMRYSPHNNSILASVSDNGGLYLWDVNNRRLIHAFEDTHIAPSNGLSFSPVNEMLAMTVGLDKRIVCYDIQGKVSLRTMIAESPLTSIDVASDGATVAVGSTRGSIYIYDLRHHGSEVVRTLVGHKSSVQRLSFQTPNKSRAGSKQSARRVNSATTGSPDVLSTSEPPTSAHDRVENEAEKVTKTAIFSPAILASPSTNDTQSPAQENDKQAATKQTLIPDGIFSPLNESTDSVPPANVEESYLATSADQNQLLPDHLKMTQAPRPPRVQQILLESGRVPEKGSKSPSRKSDQSTDITESNLGQGKTGIGGQETYNPDRDSIELPNHLHVSASDGDLLSAGDGNFLPPGGSGHRVTFAAPPANNLGQPVTNGVNQGGDARRNNHLQTEFVRSVIQESLEDFQDWVHQDIVRMQVEMIRQFQIQQEEIRATMQHYSVNEELLSEIDRLRTENEQLRQQRNKRL